MSATLNIQPDLKVKLEKLANVMHRDQSELANEAIGQYVGHEMLMLEKIRNGLAQAERGEFVPDGEITIPTHDPLRIGTLATILAAVAAHHGVRRDELLNRLLG